MLLNVKGLLLNIKKKKKKRCLKLIILVFFCIWEDARVWAH